MRRLTSLQLTLASIVLVVGVGTARAQSDDYAAPIYGISTTESYEQRIENLESQLASMRNNVGNYNNYAGGGCDAACGCASACDPCCGCNDCCGCCCAGGAYVRVEALMLSYHRGDGS